MTRLQCLTFIHKGLRHIFLAINWFLFQQGKDKSCVSAEVWFTGDPRLLSHGRLWMRKWWMDAGHEDWRHKGACLTSTSSHVCDMDINFLISVFRKLFITILTSGATKIHTTLQEEGLGLIHKRPSCQPTGTQTSPRSAWVWRSATNYGSLLSTSTPLRCTLWSLTGDTAQPHSVVTSGRRWLVHRPPYRPTVTRKGSTLSVALNEVLKQELVSPVMKTTIVSGVTPGSGLVLAEAPITAIHVGMRLLIHQTMETSTSRLWVTSWFSNKS